VASLHDRCLPLRADCMGKIVNGRLRAIQEVAPNRLEFASPLRRLRCSSPHGVQEHHRRAAGVRYFLCVESTRRSGSGGRAGPRSNLPDFTLCSTTSGAAHDQARQDTAMPTTSSSSTHLLDSATLLSARRHPGNSNGRVIPHGRLDGDYVVIAATPATRLRPDVFAASGPFGSRALRQFFTTWPGWRRAPCGLLTGICTRGRRPRKRHRLITQSTCSGPETERTTLVLSSPSSPVLFN